MTKSFNGKAPSAFRKLGAVVLITATLAVFFTACNQTSGGNTDGGGGKPTPTPTPTPTKYTVTLNQTEHGKVTASPEIPANKLVVKDTVITFTATANAGYKVGKWKVTPAEALQAGTGADGSPTAKVKITADTTVSVSFEAIPPTKHAITFSVEGANGTLKAKADGVDETSTSPINVEEGKTVTFTAEPSTNYKVKEWKVGDTVVTGNKTNTYTHTVTQPANITVSFELRPVENGAVLILSPDKLDIKVKAKTEDGSAIAVEGCTEATLASNTQTGLHATGTVVILKGNITELYCGDNKLAALNVQGLTALQKFACWHNQLPELNVQGLTALQELDCSRNQLPELNVQGLTKLQILWCSNNQLPELNVQGLTALRKLYCQGNQLNAKAMTALLNALPQRKVGDGASATLYTEMTDVTEGNCKDYTQPAELKAAFEGAKSRKWWLQKVNAGGGWRDI